MVIPVAPFEGMAGAQVRLEPIQYRAIRRRPLEDTRRRAHEFLARIARQAEESIVDVDDRRPRNSEERALFIRRLPFEPKIVLLRKCW